MGKPENWETAFDYGNIWGAGRFSLGNKLMKLYEEVIVIKKAGESRK